MTQRTPEEGIQGAMEALAMDGGEAVFLEVARVFTGRLVLMFVAMNLC